MVGNAWFFILPFLYWGILTVLMKVTEEKWLKDGMARPIKSIADALTVVGRGCQKDPKRTEEEDLRIHEGRQEKRSFK